MMEYFEDLIAIFEEGAGSKLDRATAIYQLIEQAPAQSRATLMRTACEMWDGSDPDGTLELPHVLSEEDAKALRGKYSRLVDTLLEALIMTNPSEDDFYPALWAVVNGPIFNDEKVRYFTLFWILIDARIPYFALGDGLMMTNERFKLVNNRIQTQRARVRFAIKRQYEQRTQRASILLAELDTLTGEDRAVLMAYILELLSGDSNVGKLLGGLSQFLPSSD